MRIIPDIGMMVRVFTNDPGHLGSISGWVIPKTQKIVLDTSLLNTQQYKVGIKGKVDQSRERSSALPYSVVAIEKGAFGPPSTKVDYYTGICVINKKLLCVCLCVCLCIFWTNNMNSGLCSRVSTQSLL